MVEQGRPEAAPSAPDGVRGGRYRDVDLSAPHLLNIVEKSLEYERQRNREHQVELKLTYRITIIKVIAVTIILLGMLGVTLFLISTGYEWAASVLLSAAAVAISIAGVVREFWRS